MSTRSPGLVALRLPRPRERMPTLATVTPAPRQRRRVVDVLLVVLLERRPVLGIERQPELVDDRVVEEVVHRLGARRPRGTERGPARPSTERRISPLNGVFIALSAVLTCGGRDMRLRPTCPLHHELQPESPVQNVVRSGSGLRSGSWIVSRTALNSDPPESVQIPVAAQRDRAIAVGQDVGGARIRERRLAAGSGAAEPQLLDPGHELEAARPPGRWDGSARCRPPCPSPVSAHVPARYQPCAITSGRSTSPRPCPFL